MRYMCFAALLVLALVQPTQASGTIVLDGQFNDWLGKPCINDPEGDASKKNGQGDIRSLCYTTNPDDSTMYVMVEKWNAVNTPPAEYAMYVDTNNDGDYTDVEDRQIKATYTSNANRSEVTVVVYNGSGILLQTLATNQNWGDYSAAGGTRCEFGISFSALGIQPNQAITMMLISDQGGAIDSTSFVQWSPANALGYGLLVLLIATAGWSMTRIQRRLA